MSIATEVASSSHAAPSETKEIVVNSAAEFVARLAELDREEGTETFYRGHADKDWKLIPSILRTPNGPEKEDQMFRDMVAHEPQSFSECRSALDHLVQMQHYGLPTRLLDVTMNPLVALYFACEEDTSHPTNGAVFVFSVPEEKVKHYDSDTVSVLANLAKCKEDDLSLLLYPTCDVEYSFYDSLRPSLSFEAWNNHRLHEAVWVGIFMLLSFSEETFPGINMIKNEALAEILESGKPVSQAYIGSQNPYRGDDPWVDELWERILWRIPWPKWETPYQKWLNSQDGIAILLHQIQEEKPHFQPLIHPYDLVSIFVVKAKYGNQRIVNQAGAFLLFGLGLASNQDEDGYWGPLYCDKGKVAKVPDGWIKRRFIIPSDKKDTIRKELANLGITDSYIYPGIEQYAKELKQRYKI